VPSSPPRSRRQGVWRPGDDRHPAAPILRNELTRARGLTDRPIAVNALLPFARPEHWDVAREADAVVTF